MDLFVESFDVGQLVRDVEAIVQPLVEKNANALVVSCPDNVGTMHADQTKVRQAPFNLLSNAAKFTDHGTITLSVTREPDDWLTFSDTFQTAPPMPWYNVHAFTDAEARSLYQYIKSLPGGLGEPAPAALPPG